MAPSPIFNSVPKLMAVIVIATVLVLGISTLAWPAVVNYIHPASPTTTTTTTTTNTNQYSLNLPLAFSVLDLYTGQGLATTGSGYTTGGAVLVSIINPSTGLQTDSASITSGSTTSANSAQTNYASNSNWFVTICRQGTSSSPACTTNPETNTTTFYGTSITVPYAQATTQTLYTITLYAKSIGTYSLSVLTDTSVAVTAGSTTTLTGTVTKIWTIIVADTVDNTGFSNFLNVNTNRQLNLDLRFTVTNSNSTLVAIDDWTVWGPKTGVSTVYYGFVPSSAFVDRQKLPQGTLNPNAKGTFTQTFTLDTATAPAGNLVVFKLQAMAFFSDQYFSTQLANNPEALSVSTFTFNIKRA
jgi:hypothetical protein